MRYITALTVLKQRTQQRAAIMAAVLLIGPLNPLSNLLVRGQDIETEAAGDLDPSFGSGGKVTTDFSGLRDSASAIAIQSDGKIVAAGTSRDAPNHDRFAVARYNADGSLDSSFGSGGKVTTDFSQYGAFGAGLVLQSDGKIIVAGFAAMAQNRPFSLNFALARYNPNGSLDTSFGTSGKATTDFFGHGSLANAVAIAPDGGIVVAGFAYNQAAIPKFAIARFTPQGGLDNGFGTNGKVSSEIVAASADGAQGVVIQPDRKILIAGFSGVLGVEKFAVVRYNPNGSLDTSFGTSGAVTTAVTTTFSAGSAIALQADGKIVVAGSASVGASADPFDFALARYNPDGTLDPTFSGGTVTTDLSGHNDAAAGIAIQGDGKILVTGLVGYITSNINNSGHFAIARYNSNGSLDTSFGTGGEKVTDFFGYKDAGSKIALQSDGKIVVAGAARSTSDFDSNDFALVRYLVDPDFGLSLAQPVIQADRGTKVPVDISINRAGGFTGNVTIMPPDLSPIGVKVKPPDPISTTDSSIRVKLKVKGGAAAGTHQVTFTGKDDAGRTRSASLTLNIN